MNVFTRRGIRFLLGTFAAGFAIGGVVSIVGFCMIVDLMAGGK